MGMYAQLIISMFQAQLNVYACLRACVCACVRVCVRVLLGVCFRNTWLMNLFCRLISMFWSACSQGECPKPTSHPLQRVEPKTRSFITQTCAICFSDERMMDFSFNISNMSRFLTKQTMKTRVRLSIRAIG